MAGRKFNPAAHPRDRFGRFTKSRTVKATAKDKATAKAVADGFNSQQASDRKAYLRKISGSDSAGQAVADVAAANKALRADKDAPGADALEQAMVVLPDDVLLSRRVPLTAFGATDPQSLAGMKVRDAGFAPTQLGTVTAAEGQVRMRIAAPAGTRAAINPDTGEVVLDRDTEMVVARVEANPSGGVDMYLTVLPKLRTSDPDGVKPAKQGVKSDEGEPGGQPDGGDTVRADLMKLKVPELQAQMRERGLKPSRLRKSQMVDALVADETGVVPSAESAKPSTVEPPPVGAEAGALERGIASGIASSETVSGGEVGDVRIVTFNDGSKAIQKIAHKTFAGYSPQDLTDREYLAARVGEALGAPVPQVVRTGDTEVFMEFVEGGVPGAKKIGSPRSKGHQAKLAAYMESDSGRRLGLLDLLVANSDRHGGNWLVLADNSIVGIDHGLSWPPGQVNEFGRRFAPSFNSPFAETYNTGINGRDQHWNVNDLSPADMSWAAGQLRTLQGEFEALGRSDLLDYSLFRLRQMTEWAGGDVDRIKP